MGKIRYFHYAIAWSASSLVSSFSSFALPPPDPDKIPGTRSAYETCVMNEPKPGCASSYYIAMRVRLAQFSEYCGSVMLDPSRHIQPIFCGANIRTADDALNAINAEFGGEVCPVCVLYEHLGKYSKSGDACDQCTQAGIDEIDQAYVQAKFEPISGTNNLFWRCQRMMQSLGIQQVNRAPTNHRGDAADPASRTNQPKAGGAY